MVASLDGGLDRPTWSKSMAFRKDVEKQTTGSCQGFSLGYWGSEEVYNFFDSTQQ